MSDSRVRLTWFALASVVLFCADRVLKWFSYHRWSADGIQIASHVQLTFLLNKGIALSLPVVGWVYFVLMSIVMVGLLVWLARSIQRGQWTTVGWLIVILVGAFSNILDRVQFGGVIDYFQFVFPSVINLADVMVVGGMVGLVVGSSQYSNQKSNPTNQVRV